MLCRLQPALVGLSAIGPTSEVRFRPTPKLNNRDYIRIIKMDQSIAAVNPSVLLLQSCSY